MLTHPDGDLMVKKAIDGLKGVDKKDIIITILKEHEEKYDIIRGLKENIGNEIKIILLEKSTSSQSETVFLTLEKANITEECFFVKDSDNYFEIDINFNSNYICYSDLNEYTNINPSNKSYIIMNNHKIITKMIEKNIFSQFFNVGGYFFKDPLKFKAHFKKLMKNPSNEELYLSNLVEDMILNGNEIFFGREVSNYHDWGTLKDWQDYRKRFKTYIFDIDGIFFKNSAQYHNPRWEDAKIIEENVKRLKEISEDPYNQIFFLTARPEKYRTLLEKEFKKRRIKYEALIMNCLHAKRIIVNDFANTTGYPSCESINIPRDHEKLRDYI